MAQQKYLCGIGYTEYEMPKRFTIYQPMISASGDAEHRIYKLLIGKSGKRWVMASQPNAADNIYVDGGPNSQGMAGRTLTFPLEEGGSVNLQGPWKTTADGLFTDTGYDAREMYTSRGIVSLYCIQGSIYQHDFYVGVLHFDEEPKIGAFDRIDKLAQEHANNLGVPVVGAVVTHGGGRGIRCQPQSGAQ